MTFIEKKIVCEIAREAFTLWPGRPEFERSCANMNAFDAWRHQEQAKAVGSRSLSNCDSRHFPRLKEHFQNLRSAYAAAARRECEETAAGQRSLF